VSLRDEAERLFQFFYDHCPILLIRPTPSQQLSQSQIERIHAAMATMPPQIRKRLIRKHASDFL
jgi:hypothetical protein